MKLTRKFVTSPTLAIALALGLVASASLVATPASAAKKKKKDEGQKLEFSKGFVAVAGPAQSAFDELGKRKDVQAAQAQVDAAIQSRDDQQVASARAAMNSAIAGELNQLEQVFGAIENESDRFLAGSLAVNLGNAAKDPNLQRRGIKSMLASGKSEPEQVPRFNAIAGQLAYQAGDNADAHKYLQQAVNLGYTDNNVEVVLAEAYMGDNKAAQGVAVLKKALDSRRSSGSLAPDSWYRRGLLSAYNAGMLNETADFGAMLIRDHPEPKNIGAAATILREIGAFGSQETLDLMRLIGRTNSYAEERDYVEYIQAADPRRLPGEVLEVISAGIASGRLSSDDTFVSDARAQASERAAGDRAGLSSYAADARKPSASVATVTGAADALLSYGEVAEAEELYNLALGKGGTDEAQVLTRLGIAQIDQGKFGAARSTLAKVAGKRSTIAKLWAAYAEQKAAASAPAAPPATAAAQ